MRTIILSLVALLALAAPAFADPADVLPDLDQEVPSDLMVERVVLADGKVRFRLGFASAADNVGAGPLTLHGRRPSRAVERMTADQLIDQTTGGLRVVRDVGELSYVVHPDHKHWHLVGFERYELRAPGDDRPSIRSDRKTGFCLGDRYPIAGASALPGFNPTPLQGDQCGIGRPGLTSIFVGISVGWADRYEAQLEGQYIDITEAPARNYVLVHSLNTNGRIVESDTSNNASSVLFRLSRPQGRRALPRVKVLRRCPDTPTCPARQPSVHSMEGARS